MARMYQAGEAATNQIGPSGKVSGHKEVRSYGIPTLNQRLRLFGQCGNVRPREKEGDGGKRDRTTRKKRGEFGRDSNKDTRVSASIETESSPMGPSHRSGDSGSSANVAT